MRPTGRISFRDFLKGFSRASLGIRQEIAPSLSPPTRSRGHKEELWQTSQKSWLRKDCAETATGSR